ncbi:hypothetical protein [Caballeronia cordobensis]|uniref:hypothetical protein n=1 Tax=Caballeronia cordobensis TaxID=1353886 RepID=UPI00045EF867|nr:putative membrane protein [Burkholderia sp. RPE67]
MDMISRFSTVDVDGVPVLMSALELECVDHTIRDARPIDRALKTLIVYGGYIPCRVDRTKAMADLRAAMGKTLGLVWADLCRWAALEDVQIFEPDKGPDIPFAALLHTAEWMPGVTGSALAYFVRYPEMSVRTNILTRRGIFAVKLSHHEWYRKNEVDFTGKGVGWRSFVRECFARQACDMARLAYDLSPASELEALTE